MIKTIFVLALCIDEKSFEFTANEPTKEQVAQMSATIKKSQEGYEGRDALLEDLQELQEEYVINKQILELGTIGEKISTMFEQKKLNKKIFAIKKEIAELDKNLVSFNDVIEEMYAKRFELLISGMHKAELKKELEDKNIKYGIFFDAVSHLIKEAKEKK